MEKFDFREQYNRRIERGFFTVARTQFNKKKIFGVYEKIFWNNTKIRFLAMQYKAPDLKAGL
ncbi:MAG: hypothetical protein ACLRMN_02350 [Mediterraneibacter gnavus]